MKKFTKQEILELYGQVTLGEISFSRMVEIMNERVSEAEKKCVEDIPSYKRGDFLVKEYKDGKQYIFILDYISDDGTIHFHCYHVEEYNKTRVVDDFGIGRVGDAYHKCLRYATDSEKEMLIAELHKVGKGWNEWEKCIEDIPKRKFKKGDKVRRYATDSEKEMLIAELHKVGKGWNEWEKCIEDIPKRKFKKGDKVRIKDGVSSKTHCDIAPAFVRKMDELIGTTMTVDGYTNLCNHVKCEGLCWYFIEDWLELYVEELKKGDLAIFWDDNKKFAALRFYKQSNGNGEHFRHKDDLWVNWKNAIKFESKEQYEKLIKGEI